MGRHWRYPQQTDMGASKRYESTPLRLAFPQMRRALCPIRKRRMPRFPYMTAVDFEPAIGEGGRGTLDLISDQDGSIRTLVIYLVGAERVVRFVCLSPDLAIYRALLLSDTAESFPNSTSMHSRCCFTWRTESLVLTNCHRLQSLQST